MTTTPATSGPSEVCAQGHPMLRCAPPYQDIPFCPTCARQVRETATNGSR